MVQIDASFNVPTIPESEKYAGTEVDPNVFALFPEGSNVKWSESYGASFWAISHKITVTLPSGSEGEYFMKLFLHEAGREMVEGEFEATKAWYNITPDNIPEPIGWGECANRPGVFFVLLKFRNMDDEMPGPADFVHIVAKGHDASVSPTGKFGFTVTTYSGDIAFDNRWCDTWEEWFTRSMKAVMEREQRIQGPHPELEQLNHEVIEKVIPRLLRPMETNGRSIRPCLVHGDLWHGNVGVDQESDEPVLYDCGSFYGHHEFDFGMWRAVRYRTNKIHRKAYSSVASLSEPLADSDDRNALYAARCDLAVSCMWPQNKKIRELAVEEFKRLVAKYPDGYEGYAPEADDNAAFEGNQAVRNLSAADQRDEKMPTPVAMEVTSV